MGAGQLNGPSGVTVSGTDLYIADTGNDRVRVVSAANSLVGTTAIDQVGSGGVTVLSNGTATTFCPELAGMSGADKVDFPRYNVLTEPLAAFADRVLASGRFILGPEVDALEQGQALGVLGDGAQQHRRGVLGTVPEQPLVQVELCEARGPAKIQGAALQATVGQRFELFFRLMGSGDARVQVEVHHPGGALDVQPALPETRFPVLFDNRGAGRLGGSRAPELSVGAVAAAAPAATAGWLERLPEGPRRLFLHLSVHGAVTEPEAAAILGGPRELRRFSGQLEEHSRVAPFVVRVQVVGGVKRYVREGSGS